MSPYEDAERLHQEEEQLREMLRQAKKQIDHLIDVQRELRRRITTLEDAIERHDDRQEECYSIKEKMEQEEF